MTYNDSFTVCLIFIRPAQVQVINHKTANFAFNDQSCTLRAHHDQTFFIHQGSSVII